MSEIIAKLKQGQNLSFKDSKSLFSDLMEGKHTESQIIEILEALDTLAWWTFPSSWFCQSVPLTFLCLFCSVIV